MKKAWNLQYILYGNEFTIRNSYNMELVEDDESPFISGDKMRLSVFMIPVQFISASIRERLNSYTICRLLYRAHTGKMEENWIFGWLWKTEAAVRLISIPWSLEMSMDSWTSGIDMNYALSGGVLEGEFVFGIRMMTAAVWSS